MDIKDLITRFDGKDGSQIILRPAELKDARMIIQAAEEIVKAGKYIQKEENHTLDEEERYIEKMKNHNNMYTVAEREGELVGIARVLRGELDMKKHVGLFRTWVIEEAQGLGIGSRIMEYTLDWCRLNGLYKLCLTVFASNEPAHRLYLKYGFTDEGTQVKQVKLGGKYDDEILMAYFFKENE